MAYSSWQAGENIFLHKKVSIYKIYFIIIFINEQDTSFVDCKHKHMMKSGAPPERVVSCTVWLLIEFHGFTSRINSKGYHSLVPGLISFFRDGMGPLKVSSLQVPTSRHSTASMKEAILISVNLCCTKEGT